jgi:hypothetical protein
MKFLKTRTFFSRWIKPLFATRSITSSEQALLLLWFVGIDRTWLNSESDSPPDPRLSTTPEERADNRFFLDDRIPKAADRGAQTFDRFVPEAEGFRQSLFQSFALGVEGLLGRWRNKTFPFSERARRDAGAFCSLRGL